MGNRSRDLDLAKVCRESSWEALAIAMDIMRDKECNANQRLRAVEIIIERGYGKAPQTIRIDNSDDQFARLRDQMLAAVEGRVLERVVDVSPAPTETPRLANSAPAPRTKSSLIMDDDD